MMMQNADPRAIFRQMQTLMAPWRWTLLWVAAMVVLGALAELIPPLVLKRIIDDQLAQGRTDGLFLLAALYLLGVAAVQGFGFATNYLMAWAAQGALCDLRVRLFAHLQRLPVGFYDQTPLGDIISRCTADLETVDTLYSSGVARLIADLMRLVTVAIAMLAVSLPLSLVAVCVVPPLVLITNVLRIRVRAAERTNRRAIGKLNTELQETLSGVEVIQVFGRAEAFVAQFRQTLREALQAFNGATYYAAMYPSLMGIIAAAATALLLWAGVQPVLAGWQITLGALTAFVLLFRRFFEPLVALGDEWQTVQGALSGLERVIQVLELPPEKPEVARSATRQVHPDAAITFAHVTFGYRLEQPVLHELSFRVRMGEHVALVGRTGAGKSSVLNLLGGLYAPWGGEVRVAGCDPRHLAEDERRRVIGVVPQMTQLFSGTVLENLTLGDATVTQAAVERAAALTGAESFIRALPQGYESVLTTGAGAGVQLSAGQRQLLALTRALVWDPPVLLLDEATAAIDSASEAAFRYALQRERRRVLLTVAHRLSTAREADRVLVLDAGRILEQGSPATLIERHGRFAALLELEAAGWDWRQGLPAPVSSKDGAGSANVGFNCSESKGAER